MGYEAYFALKTQIEKDSSAERNAQFSYLLSQRPLTRIFYRALSFSPRNFGGALCLLYAAAVSARRADFGGSRAVAVEKLPNEQKQIDLLWPVLRGHGFVRWQIRPEFIYSLFYFLRQSAAHPMKAVKAFRIAKILFRRQPLFVAMRAAEAMFSYFFFRELIREKRVNILASSSDGNPYGRALMAAAKASGVPLVFISHGAIAESPVRAKFALALLHGRAAAEDFALRGSEIRDVLYMGHRRENGIQIAPEIRRVLICLGSAPRLESLRDIASQLRHRFPLATLKIRPHPHAQSGKKELVGLCESQGWICASALKVEEDLRECDLTLAANSTVHLEVLAAGIPSIYVPDIDPVGTRPLAFIRNGLLANWENIKNRDDLEGHFAKAGFRDQFEFFMSQEKSTEEFLVIFQRKISDLLNGSFSSV